jgi:hypothetical protein
MQMYILLLFEVGGGVLGGQAWWGSSCVRARESANRANDGTAANLWTMRSPSSLPLTHPQFFYLHAIAAGEYRSRDHAAPSRRQGNVQALDPFQSRDNVSVALKLLPITTF